MPLLVTAYLRKGLKSMSKDRLILEYAGAVPSDKVAWIKHVMANNSQLNEIKIESNRQGATVYISDAKDNVDVQAVDVYLASVFSDVAAKVNGVYKPMFPSADSGYEYHRYDVGQQCLLHQDGEVILGRAQRAYEKGVIQDHTVSLVRYATAVLFLSDADEGGELVFPDADVSFKPKAGTIVVFPPYGAYAHYVTECVVPREVVVTWFVYTNVNAILI